jgi:hypothetical protein
MRIAHRYQISDGNLKIIKPLKSILDTYNISYDYNHDPESSVSGHKYQLEFVLYEDNPSFSKVIAAIKQFDIESETASVYEKSDIENAKWFMISTGAFQFPQPEKNFGYLETTFNLENYCRLCGIGKVQNGPFRLKAEPKQSNSQFWGLHWEYEPVFVQKQTKNILENQRIKGIHFSQPVLDKKSIPVSNLYQLNIDTVLTEGFDGYNTNTITCKINNEEDLNTNPDLKCCGRIKFHHPMIGGYLFDKSVFNPALDIVLSNEYFGSGSSANRLVIVSKRFKDCVDKNKLKGLKFTPIVHERFKK